MADVLIKADKGGVEMFIDGNKINGINNINGITDEDWLDNETCIMTLTIIARKLECQINDDKPYQVTRELIIKEKEECLKNGTEICEG